MYKVKLFNDKELIKEVKLRGNFDPFHEETAKAFEMFERQVARAKKGLRICLYYDDELVDTINK